MKELVELLLQKAITVRASDIFILPKNKGFEITMRFANRIETLKVLPNVSGIELINYLKFAAQMDISEHRRPQVGSLVYKLAEIQYSLRLSSIGEFAGGESLVIRILYELGTNKYLFEDQLWQLIELSKKRGLILTSGPTGSGKTSTMYEIAKTLSKNKVVMTIEDPVEIHEAQFLQTQVNQEAGISYQKLLKAALRHRPDILIIGEIRDSETARLSVDAALSGHLVLATVHAKNTLQTISRLEGLGISRIELLNCLTAVSYQRLLTTSENKLACLLDIATDKNLQEQIISDYRGNFIDWRDKLNYLLKERIINATTHTDFWEG